MFPQDVKTQNVKKQPHWHIIPYIAPEFQSFRSSKTRNRTYLKQTDTLQAQRRDGWKGEDCNSHR